MTTSSPFYPFPKITALKNVVHDLEKPKTVHYGAKVKLHGTNAAVRVSPDGTVTAQKRNSDLTSGPDNAGFRAFVLQHVDAWRSAAGKAEKNIVVFGEWAGTGVHRAVEAVAQLPERHFFVFGVVVDDQYFAEPDVIATFVPTLPRVRVIPWLAVPGTKALCVNYGDTQGVEAFADAVNDLVATVAATDPLIAEWFDIHGPGEGVVLTPSTIIEEDGQTFCDGMDIERCAEMQFKAKSEAHMVQTTTKAATTRIVPPATVAAFVKDFVTEARCEQGVREVCDGSASVRRLGQFAKWMTKDVRDECAAELKAMELEWKDVSKAVSQEAVKWFRNTCTATED